MKMNLIKAIIIMTLFSCSTIPKGVEAVKDFEKERYLGKWYEIARIDFKFEKDLNNTTAEYSQMEDGKIKVLNGGFNYKKNKWQAATGKAKFVGSNEIAMLKVSFFGPFYAGYNVIKLDKDYQYALVSGKNFDYLWILSRTPVMPETIKDEYVKFAQSAGFDTSRLIWVVQKKE
jgi:apolipoprotein D and lipocalin family protein